MFQDVSNFLFVKTLESNWLEIQQEALNLRSNDYHPWGEKHLYNNDGWDVFILYYAGKKIDKNCAACPKTAKLLDNVPYMVTAGFSLLRPDTYIEPHQGFSTPVLRCHLGLVVPQSCGIRVLDQTRQWEEGKCLIFDDASEHEAWNKGNSIRIILLVDFLKPGTTVSQEELSLIEVGFKIGLNL